MKHYITFNKKYHNESTASGRSVMNYSGASMCGSGGVYVCVCGGGGGGGGEEGTELKLSLQDPNARSQLP